MPGHFLTGKPVRPGGIGSKSCAPGYMDQRIVTQGLRYRCIDAPALEERWATHGSHSIAPEGNRDELGIQVLAITKPYFDPIAKEIDGIFLQAQIQAHVGV